MKVYETGWWMDIRTDELIQAIPKDSSEQALQQLARQLWVQVEQHGAQCSLDERRCGLTLALEKSVQNAIVYAAKRRDPSIAGGVQRAVDLLLAYI